MRRRNNNVGKVEKVAIGSSSEVVLEWSMEIKTWWEL